MDAGAARALRALGLMLSRSLTGPTFPPRRSISPSGGYGDAQFYSSYDNRAMSALGQKRTQS
jgi:hypothetical protein